MSGRRSIKIVADDCKVVRIGEIIRRLEAGETMKQIGDEIGVSESAVSRALTRAGIKRVIRYNLTEGETNA